MAVMVIVMVVIVFVFVMVVMVVSMRMHATVLTDDTVHCIWKLPYALLYEKARPCRLSVMRRARCGCPV